MKLLIPEKSLNYILLIPLFVSLFVMTSCNKEDDDMNEDENEEQDNSTTSAKDNSIAQAAWDDAGDQADNSAESNAVNGSAARDGNWNGCAAVTVDSLGSPFPIQVTLDFGTQYCIGLDGRQRKGKLIYRLTDRYRNAGAVLTVESDGYHVDGYGVEGTRRAENLGENNAGQLHFNIQVTDAIVTTPEGETISWNSDRTRTWVEGEDTGFLTPDGNGGFLGWDGILDDVYEITGDGFGTDRDSNNFDWEITTALRAELSCAYITSGVLELNPEGKLTRTIDYGNGGCDSLATVSVGNWEGEIVLR